MVNKLTPYKILHIPTGLYVGLVLSKSSYQYRYELMPIVDGSLYFEEDIPFDVMILKIVSELVLPNTNGNQLTTKEEYMPIYFNEVSLNVLDGDCGMTKLLYYDK